MKITKEKLKEMIQEELESIKEELNSKQQLTEGTTLNSGVWKGLKTRESGVHCINGKTELFIMPGTGTIFNQFLWQISPAEGYLASRAIDADGNIDQYNHAILDGWGKEYIDDIYWYNKLAGMDIEPHVPRKNAYKMNKDYQRLPLKTQIKMAHGDHKLATRFLAKYGIEPSTGQ